MQARIISFIPREIFPTSDIREMTACIDAYDVFFFRLPQAVKAVEPLCDGGEMSDTNRDDCVLFLFLFLFAEENRPIS